MLAAVIAAGAALSACSVASGGEAHADVRSPMAASPGARVVPMTVVRHGRATLEAVPVFVDGKGPFVFILDTGSAISSVSMTTASDLHVFAHLYN